MRARRAGSRGMRTNQLLSGTTFVTDPSGVTIEVQTDGLIRNVGGTEYYPTFYGTNSYKFEHQLLDSANNAVFTAGVSNILYTTLSTITTAVAVIPLIYMIASGSSTAGSGVSIVDVSFGGSGVTVSTYGGGTSGARVACNNGTSIQIFAFGV